VALDGQQKTSISAALESVVSIRLTFKPSS
jgi:hypothetical protein